MNHEIRTALLNILSENPRNYWLSYSLWIEMGRRWPNLTEYLLAQYGPAIGKHGNDRYGPISHISKLLATTPGVERADLRTKGLTVDGIVASGEFLAIFRSSGPILQ